MALKVISDGERDGQADADANARLLREARAAAALDHPNAVSIFDVGEYEGTPFIVMELVSGRTLRGAVGDASVPAATCLDESRDDVRARSIDLRDRPKLVLIEPPLHQGPVDLLANPPILAEWRI